MHVKDVDHNLICDVKTGAGPWLLMECTPKPEQTAPVLHYIL